MIYHVLPKAQSRWYTECCDVALMSFNQVLTENMNRNLRRSTWTCPRISKSSETIVEPEDHASLKMDNFAFSRDVRIWVSPEFEALKIAGIVDTVIIEGLIRRDSWDYLLLLRCLADFDVLLEAWLGVEFIKAIKTENFDGMSWSFTRYVSQSSNNHSRSSWWYPTTVRAIIVPISRL